MATCTWLGGSASWTAATFWTVGDARLSSGWHAPERDLRRIGADGGIALNGVRSIGFRVVSTGRYWVRAGARASAAT